MIKAIFVHSDHQTLDRLAKESHQEALITSSMVQALRWIMDPTLRLSGIFLNPSDSSFSAFQFLEITLTHRPAIPIFLFEPQLSENQEQAKKVMNSAHIRGVFSGSEPYSTLITSLESQLKEPSTPRRADAAAIKMKGYQAIPISDLFTCSDFPHDFFLIEPDGQTHLFGNKGLKIDASYLASAAEKHEFIYLRSDDIEKEKEDVRNLKHHYLTSEIPNDWKAAEALTKTKSVLTEMRKNGVSEELVDYTKEMLDDLFKLIAHIDSDEGAMHSLIEKAKQTDRSVFCASYSLLIAKQLRFEKNSTLEILGLASILQDISLYQTPFGDLTAKSMDELKDEELGYYMKHPTLSADLVSNHTDIPAVTLQVMRQHHERKDRSGFPNRVGGTQLHPMAEILSLINAYYEIISKGTDESAAIIELQSDVFQHYSENVVRAFRSVLGALLQDKLNNHTRL